MKGQGALRKALLLAIYRESCGDLTREFGLDEMAEVVEAGEQALNTVAQQLAEKRWLSLNENPYHHSFTAKITMAGVEEAEKLDRPFHQRWPSEHPLLFGSLMSVITGLVMLLLGRLVGHLF